MITCFVDVVCRKDLVFSIFKWIGTGVILPIDYFLSSSQANKHWKGLTLIWHEAIWEI